MEVSSIPTHNQELVIRRELERLCELWGIGSICEEIEIEFSSRLKCSLGRTQPAIKKIRLNKQLSSGLFEYLEEVLCHEIAHIAAFHKFGNSVRPHGEEWRTLIRIAGFEPKTKLNVSLRISEQPSTRKFCHNCPVCLTKRIAKVKMTRWRCEACVREGLDGNLVIEEVL